MAFEITEGKGFLQRVKKKRNDKSPEFYGHAKIDGVIYTVALWVNDGKEGKYLSLSFRKKKEKNGD